MAHPIAAHDPSGDQPEDSRSAGWVTRFAPPGPFRPGFWRSPLRGPWLTAVFASVLLIGIPILFVTGLLSYAAYNPGLAGNDLTPDKGILGFYLFDWPTHPHWLYRVTQGVHVTLGLVLIPVLFGKLWSVIPKLFTWPPVKSPAQALERLSLLMLVGGALFEFLTGVLNIEYWYIFPGSFYTLHFYGAWVFIAGFVAHVGLKFPRMVTALQSRRLRDELRVDAAHTDPEARDPDGLVTANPARPTMSRRGVLSLVGAGSLSVLLLTVGQSIGGVFRSTALLAPRGQDRGSGPTGFQVNKTARDAGITQSQMQDWHLTVDGGVTPQMFTRDQLLAMPQHTAHLPIACVEGWSTTDQAWTGVRLADLAKVAGVTDPVTMHVSSLQQGSPFAATTLRRNQVLDGDSLLALKVNGVDLSADHGFPARVIVPANPGVHNTKWVARLTFTPQ